MDYFNGTTLALMLVGVIGFALIHGLGFRLAGNGQKPNFVRRMCIQLVLVPVIIVASYLLQFMPIGVLRIFDPIFHALPIGRTGAGLSPEQAGKISLIIMGGVSLAISIGLLAILLAGVTKLVARDVSLPRAFLAALWTYVILPGIPAMIGLAVAISRIPG